MIIELQMLVGSAALLFVLTIIQAQAGVAKHGLEAMAGSREKMEPPAGFAGRAHRAVVNHIEGLAIFAPLLLAAVISHKTNSWTALGAQGYFYGRVAHAGLYLFGVPWLRSVAYIVCVVGGALVFLTDVGVL